MRKQISRNEILISRRRVAQKRGVPTYYLTGKAVEHIDKLYKEGMREYKQGKTIKAESLGEALKIRKTPLTLALKPINFTENKKSFGLSG